MITPNVSRTPGVRTGQTYTHREVLMNPDGAGFMPVSRIINGTASRDPDNTGYLSSLRPGLVLGKDATDDKYTTAILGITDVAYVSGVDTTTLSVTAQCAVEIARRYTSGTQNFYVVANQNDDNADEEIPPPAELITYSAVNQSNGNLTITALDYSYPVGSLIIAADAVHNIDYGSGIVQLTNLQILIDDVKVTDDNGDSIDVFLARPLIRGTVNVDRIINYPTEPKTQRWFKKQLNQGKALSFSDDI
jgi:hypothetical protein